MRDFVTGVRYFGRGLGLLASRPKLLLIGVLPAVLTTVILLGASYEQCWKGITELVSGLSADEQRAVLGDTATRVYGL